MGADIVWAASPDQLRKVTMQFSEIVQVMRSRQARDDTRLRAMLDVCARYNGDWALPMNDVVDPTIQDLTPALVAETIDGTALRAASSIPTIVVPSLNPLRDTGPRSADYADRRRKALASTWADSNLQLGLRRVYRHLGGFAELAIRVEPDKKRERPVISVLSPMGVYPESKTSEDLSPPLNVGIVYAKSASWIRQRWPKVATENGGPVPAESMSRADGGDLWDIVEWVDEDHIVFGLLGPRYDTAAAQRYHQATRRDVTDAWAELERHPNKVGRCTIVTGERVTLDRAASQVANMLGRLDKMAQLQVLTMIAAEKAVFPDRYIIADANGTIRIAGGSWKDGRTGAMNVVEGPVKNIGELRGTPDPSGQQMVDRLERNWRVSTGLAPVQGGETMGALRTGRGIDSMLAASIDPRVQEMQEIVESALTEVNALVLDCAKTAYGSKKFVWFTGWRGDRTLFEFEPDKHVESNVNAVHYSMPGSDVQSLTIILGQLYGMEAISLDTLREMHPGISDADAERLRVDEQKIANAALDALLEQAKAGEIPVTHLLRIQKHLRKEKSVLAAIELADKELAEEQAKENPAPPEGMAMDPAAMPGLAPAGAMPPPGAFGAPGGGPQAGGPAPGPQIGPTDGQVGFRKLAAALSQAPPTQ